MYNDQDLESGSIPLTESPDNEYEHGKILYQTNFSHREEQYVKYKSMKFFLACLIMIPFYGIGILMLIYLPVYAYIARRDIRSRRLYITTESVVYRTAPPVHVVPCCGVTMTEKHTLLPLVTDVIVEQGCLQSKYGIHSIKIENAGQTGGKKTYDVEIDGLDDPREFKKILLIAATARRAGRNITENDIQQLQKNEDVFGSGLYPSPQNNNESSNPMVLEQLQKTNETLLIISKLLQEQSEKKKEN